MINPRELLDAMEADGRPLNVGEHSARLIDLITYEGHICTAVELNDTAVLTFDHRNPQTDRPALWSEKICDDILRLWRLEIVFFQMTSEFLKIEFNRTT